MPGEIPPRDADIEKVNVGLTEGLKSCRSVVANYKSLLLADKRVEKARPSQEPAAGDD